MILLSAPSKKEAVFHRERPRKNKSESSPGNKDRTDIDQSENDWAKKSKEAPEYDKLEDENYLSRHKDMKDGESGSNVEENGLEDSAFT